jgi:hypothetical protein
VARAISKRKRPKAKKLSDIDEALMPVVNVATARIIDPAPIDTSFLEEARDRAALSTLREMLGECAREMLSLRGVYDDMLRCRRLTGKYPWRPSDISRSEYLHLMWMLFLNLCYLFRERAKSYANSFNRTVRAYNVGEQIDVAALLKTIDKSLKKQIRARGRFTHESLPGHERIVEYGMYEFLHRVGRWPKEFPKHSVFYFIARGTVESEMNQDIEKTKVVLLDILRSTSPHLAQSITVFNTTYDKLKAAAKKATKPASEGGNS